MLWQFHKNTLPFGRKAPHLTFTNAYIFRKLEKLHLLLIYVSPSFTLPRFSEYILLEKVQVCFVTESILSIKGKILSLLNKGISCSLFSMSLGEVRICPNQLRNLKQKKRRVILHLKTLE